MDILKKIWPSPFKVAKGDVAALIIHLVVFVAAMLVVGIVTGMLSGVAVLSVIFWILGPLAELYGTVGIILCVLRFIGVV